MESQHIASNMVSIALKVESVRIAVCFFFSQVVLKMSRHTQDKQYQYSEFSQKSLPVCIYNLQFQLPRSFGELTVMSVGNTSVQPVYANMSNT